MKIDHNSVLIVGNPQGILDQELRPYAIHLIYINKLIIQWYNYADDHPIQRQKRTSNAGVLKYWLIWNLRQLITLLDWRGRGLESLSVT